MTPTHPWASQIVVYCGFECMSASCSHTDKTAGLQSIDFNEPIRNRYSYVCVNEWGLKWPHSASRESSYYTRHPLASLRRSRVVLVPKVLYPTPLLYDNIIMEAIYRKISSCVIGCGTPLCYIPQRAKKKKEKRQKKQGELYNLKSSCTLVKEMPYRSVRCSCTLASLAHIRRRSREV
jgi:hypothetical protein